jgi:hypothetical protein
MCNRAPHAGAARMAARVELPLPAGCWPTAPAPGHVRLRGAWCARPRAVCACKLRPWIIVSATVCSHRDSRSMQKPGLRHSVPSCRPHVGCAHPSTLCCIKERQPTGRLCALPFSVRCAAGHGLRDACPARCNHQLPAEGYPRTLRGSVGCPLGLAMWFTSAATIVVAPTPAAVHGC